MGLEYMSFQYHHLIVLLTRHSDSDHKICVQAARDAISKLDKLVSTSAQVYNGVVWQLLYYPFTPFFALFGNIIRAPLATSVSSDINHLWATKIYFAKMTSSGNMAGKLEKISEVFCSLARMYVEESGRKVKVQKQPPIQQDYMSGIQTPALSDNDGIRIQMPNDEFETNEFLSWLSTASLNQQDMLGVPDTYGDLNTVNPADVFGSLMTGGSNRPLEYDFDWFSWDSYTK